MDKQSVMQQLKSVLTEDLFVAVPVDQIKETDSISNDLGLDSVGFVELSTIISEKYGIQVEDSALADGHFATLAVLYDYMVSRRAAVAA